MNNLDRIDESLLSLLGKDAHQSSKKLAEQLNISAAVVRRRINKLVQMGVLRILGVVDPCKIAPCFIVLLALDVEAGSVESAMEILASRSEVRWVISTTGRFDVIAVAWFRSADGLASFLREEISSIDGIRNSETFVCLNVGKHSYFPL